MWIDESGFAHGMPRTHGYAAKGERCFGTSNWGARGRTNVIGALLGGLLLTVGLFATTVNTIVFTHWLKQDLLKKLPKHCVIIMDNASFHKGEEMKKVILQHGHILEYLPPYSPDLNPIEKKWAQTKKLRQKQQCNVETLFKNNVAIL